MEPTGDIDLAFQLEKMMVKPKDWDICGAPAGAVELAKRESDTGAPTGIAKHPTLGWFVIQTTGQGPYIIWEERKNDSEIPYCE